MLLGQMTPRVDQATEAIAESQPICKRDYALAGRFRAALRGIDRFWPNPIFFASAERVLA